MGILETLISFFILLFPIAEVGKFQIGNGISVSINDIGLVTLFVISIFSFLNKKQKMLRFYLLKPIVIFVVIGLISLILNLRSLTIITFVISLLYLVRFAASSSLYFVIRDFSKPLKEKLTKIMLISGFVVVILGFIQYLFYPSLKNLFYLGWDEHLYRMFSTFLDPNFAGAFFVIYFLFTISFFKKSQDKKDKFRITLFGSMSFLTLISVYLTYSRSAFLMLVVGSVTYLTLINKKKFILILLVILFAMIFISPKAFQTEGTDFLRINSSKERIESSEVALKIFEQSPILGVGFNAYRYAQNKLGMNSSLWQTTHSGAGTDNSFLFVLATTGIVGFVSYIYLLFKILKLAKKNIKNTLAPVLFACILGLLINSLFINSLFYIFILEWIWIMCGLIENN